MQADAPDLLPFDEGHLEAQLTGFDGRRITSATPTDDYKVKGVHNLPFLSLCQLSPIVSIGDFDGLNINRLSEF